MNLNQKQIQAIVKEYRQGLKEIFGNKLENVLLYGSCARNEARDDSDIDILVILRPPFDYGNAIRKTSELTAKMSIEHDVVISRVFASNNDYQKRNIPFFMNIRREGLPA